ncbi:7-cyano-7-deazaguanine synthase [Gorillibacterium sp. CAU 1737]|uniref:7-cyano-7-deazaguanine synthase n=1 Tax=Gorillibacterium sp. CAU 1737 TaxID=3140362 RepID=UPI003261084E
MAYDFIGVFHAQPYEILLGDVITHSFETDFDCRLLDLVDVMATIFCNDITTERIINQRRKFDIVVPVANPDIWEEARETLKELLLFVSKDHLNIKFTKQDKRLIINNLPLRFGGFHNVSLLSGGLDSFCGAYRNIESGLKSIYCGYKLNTFEQGKQDSIKEFVTRRHTDSLLYFFKKLDIEKKEPTQATRSLLFLTLASVVAYANNVENVYIYENGILSLNPVKNGRFTTKTTHPRTIMLYNRLLSILEIKIKVWNPFQFETKGQILARLSKDFKNKIVDTHTCSMSRQNRYIHEKKKQCGFCVPCILRKISLASYDNEKYDVEYEVSYEGKLRHISDNYQISEYKSSVEYFKAFKADIDSGDIYHLLGLKEGYYKEIDFLQKTDQMLREFSKEVERYLRKYDIY